MVVLVPGLALTLAQINLDPRRQPVDGAAVPLVPIGAQARFALALGLDLGPTRGNSLTRA